MLVLWFGSGCTPGEPATPAGTTTTPSPIETNADPRSEPTALPPEVKDRLQTAVAEAVGISPDAVTLRMAAAVEWSNACLGAMQPGELCAEVITPGYRVVFATPQGEVTVHSDRTGSSYRLVSP